MMRSLWTGATGMIAQQMNVDTISNNLANVNTASFKKERLEFKTLLYQQMKPSGDTQNNPNAAPVNLQVGLGVRPTATTKLFDQGAYLQSGNPMDFALGGEGFFVVNKGNDQIAYTKDGTFKLSYSEEGLTVVSSVGDIILSTEGQPIVIPTSVPAESVSVSRDGTFNYIDQEGNQQDLGFKFNIVQFPNRQGLKSIGNNLFQLTAASGQPLSEANGETNTLTEVIQGYIEGSNVQVAEEMVNLIVAQRAYEVNSKSITTSDEMLSIANGLKR